MRLKRQNIWGVLMKGVSKYGLIAILIISSFLLSGCIEMVSFLCAVAGESGPHCYQWFAVQSEEPDECEKVYQAEKFSGYGSNPPKDKCYLMIAENTGDPKPCENIEGGMMSYTKDECYTSAATAGGDADLCKGSPTEAECRNRVSLTTGDCGDGWEKKDGKCVQGESAADPECADPSFTSKCMTSDQLLTCSDGKKSISTCENGCFEAACRDTPGETDIEKEKDKDDKTDAVEEVELDADEDDAECNCKKEEFCFFGDCIPDADEGCKKDTDCEKNQKCLEGACLAKDKECLLDGDCAAEKVCDDNKCVAAPKCKRGDKLCVSSTTLEFCEDDKMTTKTCPNGCEDAKCLKEKKEPEPECKGTYDKCISDVTIESCADDKKTEKMCEFGCKSGVCLAEKIKCTGLQRLNPFCKEVDDDIPDKFSDDIETIEDAAKGKYMVLLDASIEVETDPAKLRGLQKYKEFLEKAGETMDNVKTDIETLQKLKRIFLDSYDPSMDIQNMPVDKILQKGLYDRISDSIFGGPKTESGKELAEADDSLAVYEMMLERQAEIDFLKKGRMDRLGDTIVEGAKSKMTEELTSKAKDIAEGVVGTAMMAVTVVDYALTSFQDEAKKQAFLGLARAYNRRRQALMETRPDLSQEQIHALTVQQVHENPYLDNKNLGFIKFGNILENKDCQDSSNPLCIDRRVFWTAMDKTYQHTHRKEIFDREMAELDERLGK